MPKRNPPAYILFYRSTKDEFKKNNPGNLSLLTKLLIQIYNHNFLGLSHQELTKFAGEKWRNLEPE